MIAPRLVVLCAALALAACSGSPAPTASTAADASAADSIAWQPAKPRDRLTLDDASTSPNVLSSLPAGTRIALDQEPRAKAGIPLPDGSFLPALNGVPRSSAIDRPKQSGPLPKVTGVTVDDKGFEWYEHQDGSMTTSRFVWNSKTKRWDAMTFHAVPTK